MREEANPDTGYHSPSGSTSGPNIDNSCAASAARQRAAELVDANASSSSNTQKERRMVRLTGPPAVDLLVADPVFAAPSTSGGGASNASCRTAGSKRPAVSSSSKVERAGFCPKRRLGHLDLYGYAPDSEAWRGKEGLAASGRVSLGERKELNAASHAGPSEGEGRAAKIARLQEMLLLVRGQVGHMVNTLASEVAREARSSRALEALKTRGR